jgi:hypothetical protein
MGAAFSCPPLSLCRKRMDQRLAGGEAWWRAIVEQIRGCDVSSSRCHKTPSTQSRVGRNCSRRNWLPTLPVQVGPVDSMQLNPLARVQAFNS